MFTLFNAYRSTFSDTLVGGVALVSRATLVCGGISFLSGRGGVALGNGGNFQV